jgi:hypothetical protein
LFDVSLWRDISIVLLAVELMIGLAPILVLLYFCVKYLPKGVAWLRGILEMARGIAQQVQATTLKAGHSVASPFIAVRQSVAAGKAMVRGAFTVTRAK